MYRSAVACFERCLDLNPSDATLTADARHNLELAKLLWAEANKRAAKRDDPNEPPPEERDPPAPPPGGEQPGASEPGPGADAANAAQPAPQQSPVPHPRTGPKPTEAKAAGNNQNLEVLKDQDQVQPLSPEDTREYLRRTAERLERQRRDLLRTLYGPDRPGVRDW